MGPSMLIRIIRFVNVLPEELGGFKRSNGHGILCFHVTEVNSVVVGVHVVFNVGQLGVVLTVKNYFM